MSTTAWIIIAVIAVVVLIAIVWWITTTKRRRGFKDQYGREYDRAVEDAGSKRAAERELAARAERHDQLGITELSPQRRAEFADRWQATQDRFVDEPTSAVGEADHLVQEVMSQRGYPVGDFDQQQADLSVAHADVLDRYRAAHAVAERSRRNEATTEDLRQGLVHYRALFVALLGADDRAAPDPGADDSADVDLRNRRDRDDRDVNLTATRIESRPGGS